jgi:hypothetical protein
MGQSFNFTSRRVRNYRTVIYKDLRFASGLSLMVSLCEPSREARYLLASWLLTVRSFIFFSPCTILILSPLLLGQTTEGQLIN